MCDEYQIRHYFLPIINLTAIKFSRWNLCRLMNVCVILLLENVLFITSSGYDAVGHGRHFIHKKIDRL